MKGLVAAMVVLFSASAFAGGVANGAKIQDIRVDSNGWGIITLNMNVTSGPVCSVLDNMLSFDTNTAGGKAFLQVAMAGYLAGKTFNFEGKGHCNTYGGNVEDISSFKVY